VVKVAHLILDKNGDGNNYTKSHSKCKINVHYPRDNTKGIQNITIQRITKGYRTLDTRHSKDHIKEIQRNKENTPLTGQRLMFKTKLYLL
jgi:hypothetical protein